MANVTITTAQSAGFIPQVWAQRALDVLRNNLVLGKIVARDTDFTQTFTQGSTITVPYPGTFTSQLKAAGTPVTPVAPVGGTGVPLVLSQHRVVPFEVEDFANAQANESLMDRYMGPASIALVEDVERDLWATLAQAGQIVPVGTPGTAATSTTLLNALTAFGNAKVPMSDRHIITGPKDQASLLGDSNLKEFFAFSKPDVILEGQFGQAYGMNIHMSQLAPTGYTVSLGAATAGTFTLTIGGQTTASLAYNASVAAVQTAVQGLSSVGAGNASVSGVGGTNGAYSIVLTGTAAGQAITGVATGLTGGTFASTAAQKNYAMHRNAVLFASRAFPAPPPNSGVMSATVTDDDSGLAIRVSAQYDINALGVRCNLDMLYGTAVLRSNQAFAIDC